MYGFNGKAAGHPPSSPMVADADWDDFPLSPGSARRPAVRGRVCGSIVEWKGKFGWIEPDAPINHPEARMKGGRIYLSQEDVAEVISGVGAHVSFYAYADGTGLGAMLCVPSDSPAASAPLKKQAKAAAPAPKPKPKAASPPGRKRVSDEKMSGKVKNWRGGFGFIVPDKQIEHPLFTGSLFLHANDVDDPTQVEVGKTVTFFLYADPQGLGAEGCAIISGNATGTPLLKRSDSSVDEGSSTLLKAKPKASAGGPADAVLGALMTPRAKGAPMMAKPKASAAGTADPELASKMAANPELARRLSAWMFDPGG
mmetsp:Transcript_78052/g.226463  ORF Transcript_78052/g.226463 Transcript_78052/m.226463 type:complete len:312 (-) Transcript_78052:69-1004(-)